MPARFIIRPAADEAVDEIAQATGLPRFVARTLADRGVTDLDALEAYVNPDLDRDLPDPLSLPGMAACARVMADAVREGKRIVVFGDYDVDGVSAGALMATALRDFGAREVVSFIPRRFDEGYALTPASLERLMTHDPEVVVTVDCGISCAVEVAELVRRGVEVVVTDHHEPGELVPSGVPVCDPKLEDGNPAQILAGVGVALCLVRQLAAELGLGDAWKNYVDLAALGTVSDLMPLVGANRAIVAYGLERIRTAPRPGIAAMFGEMTRPPAEIRASTLSFTVVPRLNAAGRMGDAFPALELLLEQELERARERARELEATNEARRAAEAELAKEALERAAEKPQGIRAMVVAGEGWHEGIKGIVASRLVDAYGVPSFLFTIEGDEARGSGRTVGDVNLFEAIESCSDLLTRHGGHAAAVGLTLPAADLPAFEQRLCDYLADLPPENFIPATHVDGVVEIADLTEANVELLDVFEPCGQENPSPVYLLHDVVLANPRAVGADSNHLSTKLTDGVNAVSAIMFRAPEIDALVTCGSVVDAAVAPEVEEWRGRRSVKAHIKAIAPARPCAALEATLSPQDRDFVDALFDTQREGGSPAGPAATPGAATATPGAATEDPAALRAAWSERLAALPDARAQRAEIVAALIGKDAALHPGQSETLDLLEADRGVLAVMGTARGKSLIFQADALRRALTGAGATLIVYPLRSLVADQAERFAELFAPFGVGVEVLAGGMAADDAAAARTRLAQGESSVALTTPEYLDFHVDELAGTTAFGLVVFDEAHHIAREGQATRPAYTEPGRFVAALGDPTTLALTATADTADARAICARLGIDDVVVDSHGRPNLHVDDRRNIRAKADYLARTVARSDKTLVYVNSRDGAQELARRLRTMLPHIAPLIGFYHAGLSKAERARIEDLFRSGVLCALVATSAFGEGVDIPGIRDVVLYHLPFDSRAFNQISGRGGRDGRPATIHLLFGNQDVKVNEALLSVAAPSRDVMADLYRRLLSLQLNAKAVAGDADPASAAGSTAASATAVDPAGPDQAPPGFPRPCVSAAELLGADPNVDPRLWEGAVACFSELGLVRVTPDAALAEGRGWVHLVEDAGKVELTDSVRYREGLAAQADFADFAGWVLGANADELAEQIAHPIAPQA